MPTFDFSIGPKPEVEAPVSAAPVTRPAALTGASRDAAADMKEEALPDGANPTRSGGSGGSGDAQAPVEDAGAVSRPQKPKSWGSTTASRGSRGKADAGAASYVKIPASLAAYAREQMGGCVTRSEAVAAYLYMVFAQGENPPEVPDNIKVFAENVPVAPNSDMDLHRELAQLQAEIAGLMNLVRSANKALLETQSAVIWLLGERLGSPGAGAEMGPQRLNIAFSDAELLRHRLATQTREREVELQTKRGRSIEDDKFRKSQREGRHET